MGETLDQRAARQDRIAHAALPRLSALADDLDAVAAELFGRRIPYDPEDGASVMALGFVTKQREHLRSVRILIDANAHRDALLIARTMVEGMGLLLWAFNQKPERTDRWYWYETVLDWHQTRENEEDGIVVDPQDKALLKAYLDKHGPKYYRPKVRKGLQAAERDGTVYEMPDDPWETKWTPTNVADMFDAVGGELSYKGIYRDASEWIHWSPRPILRAMVRAEWGVAGFAEKDWRAAVVALQAGCQLLLQSLEVLDGHFTLGQAERLAGLEALRQTIVTEAMAMGSVTTPEERAAWLAAAEAAGLSVDDDWDTLVEKAAALGIEAHGVVPSGTDVHGDRWELPQAYAVTDHTPGEMRWADSVEEALRLVIGEVLVKRAQETR